MSRQNKEIYVYWHNGVIEKMTSKKYHDEEVYLKKHLFWSNNTTEPNWVYKKNKWEYVGKVNDTDNTCQSCGTEHRNCIC